MNLVLLSTQLKSMGISHVSQFPFPTPPPAASLRASIDSLLNLNALTRVTNTSSDGTVTTTEALTPLGVRISGLPLLPRLAVMLLKARELGVLPHVIAVVAAMTAQVRCLLCIDRSFAALCFFGCLCHVVVIQNPLLRPSSAKAPGASSSVKNATADTVVDEPSDSDVSEYEEEDSEEGEGEEESVAKDTARRAAAAARAAHAKWAHPTSDALALLALVTEYSNVVAAAGTGAKEASWKWCKENYVRHKVISINTTRVSYGTFLLCCCYSVICVVCRESMWLFISVLSSGVCCLLCITPRADHERDLPVDAAAAAHVP